MEKARMPVLIAAVALALSLNIVPSAGHGAARDFQVPPPPAGVHSLNWTYQCLNRTFAGYFAWPDETIEGPLPHLGPDSGRVGVLVGHTWLGLGPMERFRAQQLASNGYVAFALDIYGEGIRPKTQKQAAGNASKVLKNVTSYYELLNCGLDQLRASDPASVPPVLPGHLLANGYCLGGQMVLEIARRGIPDVIAVSSFHGELDNLTSQTNDRISASVFVHHADGDFQGAGALLKFEDEMRSQNVSIWTTTKYGQCIHGWTDPTNAAYKPFQAEQAHRTMLREYEQILQTSGGTSA